MRGSRTHGWGTSGQHRKHGMIGGHGKAGWCKHKWTYVVKYERGRIGKRGLGCLKGSRLNAINLGELNEEVNRLLADGKAVNAEGKILINLTELGYDKLLGEGLTEKPLLIKVGRWSKSAAKKVEEAGGKVTAE